MIDTTAQDVISVPSNTTEIPEDLKQKINSLKALSSCHNLLQTGHFPFGYAEAIGKTLAFIEALHKQVLEDATQHPHANLSTELAKFLGDTNGNANKTNSKEEDYTGWGEETRGAFVALD